MSNLNNLSVWGVYVGCLCCSKLLLWLQLRGFESRPTLIVWWGTESRTEVNTVSTDPCTWWELPVTTTE